LTNTIKKIEYHVRATVNVQDVLNWHIREETAAREELARIQRLAIIPQIAEFRDIIGNLVARGKYVPATKEYVTDLGIKVAHWNSSLGRIVPVAAVRSLVNSYNRRANPVLHARRLEHQRRRYRERHPIVERPNQFI
jgi:hypothetical protein